MARVTYTGKAGRIRIPGDSVLERSIPAEIPNEIARALSPLEFHVVMPTRRPPATRRKSKAGVKRTRASKKES